MKGILYLQAAVNDPALSLSVKVLQAVEVGINAVTNAVLLSYKTSFWTHPKCRILFQKENSSYHALFLLSNGISYCSYFYLNVPFVAYISNNFSVF